ncbi:hypothetical protein F4824DRAFT_461180 [Ustulina deusta]|nr:hypothetical protein F4824DRAFT_461180 [Ustulina deusta]
MPPSRQGSFSPRAVGGRKFVAFFHPAYPYPAPPLLTLAAVDYVWDDRAGAHKVRGIEYDTAKAACGIVACNRWDDGAYFAMRCEERDQPVRWITVERPSDGLLRASGDYTYYFVVDNPSYRYPVVPSFDHWRFPHGALPPRWERLSTVPGNDNDAAKGEGEGEGYTTCFQHTLFALVAPFTHRSWYESNQMEKYCRLHGVGDTTVSGLSFDITRYFRMNQMRSKPWGQRSSRVELHPELILRVIFAGKRLSKKRDHLTYPARAAGIHREHVFARFAFHVLSDANYRFLGGDHKYTVRLFDVDKAEQYTAELYSDDIAERCQIFPPPAYIRPKKREAATPRAAKRIMESFDNSCGTGDREEEYDYSSDCSEYRPSRSGYYESRLPCEGAKQCHGDDTQHAESMEYETRVPHGGSSGGLSVSSTISPLSFDTPHTDRRSEDGVGDNDMSGFAAGQKRSCDVGGEPCTEMPPSHKRLRVL